MSVASNLVDARQDRIFCSGELHAADVSRVYDHAMAASWAGGQTVEIDLTRVTGWSAVAQAMMVGMARELARRRSRLVLTGASLGLRMKSQRLDVFNRVRSLSD